jgi:hypothetical protein
MVSASNLLLIALGALTSASPLAPRVTCQKGVYIISARGTGDYTYNGEGQTGQVADMIEAKISGSRTVAVEYQASAFYNASLIEGVTDAKKKIIEYVDSCGSGSKIVLLGFSQGGNVMSNVLAGGVNTYQPALPNKYTRNSKFATPFSSSQAKHCLTQRPVLAAAAFGDPSFTKNQSFDRGSSTKSGVFDRSENATSLARLQTFASIFRSYCDEGDQFCSTDGGFGPISDVHGKEVPNHAVEATNFIVGRYNKST